MFSLPIPFVIALLMLIFMVRIFISDRQHDRHILIFMAACTILLVLVGIRWVTHFEFIRFIQPVVATILPPLAWLCFAGLKQYPPSWKRHGIFPVIFSLFIFFSPARWHLPIDQALSVLYFGYGIALILLACHGADNFVAARLSDVSKVTKSTLLAGLALCFSALTDILIALDFTLFHGDHILEVVSAANLALLPLMVVAVAFVQLSQPAQIPDIGPSLPPDEPNCSNITMNAIHEEDIRIIETIRALLGEKASLCDQDITLDRLARKAGIPSRQISRAVNRVLGCNVSQLVNEYRIEEARRLLTQTDLPVTTIIYASGFRTKSNFNREFLRQTGMNPGDYRRSASTRLAHVKDAGTALPE
ncbi:MAG: helix-turn-helix domain-containing protein [Ewingella sp.]